MKFSSYDLIFFDLDGLLVNTEKLHFAAYRALTSELGYALPWTFWEYCRIAHGPNPSIQAALYEEFPPLKDRDWDGLYQRKKELYMHLLQKGEIELMPGVEKVLEELSTRRIKRCVVTNSTKEQVEEIKAAHKILQSIPVWITREMYERPKPAPDGYLYAKGLLADPGDRFVGFEDTLRGVQALKEAGIDPVLICSENHPQMELKTPVVHFSSFEALKPLMVT